MKPGLSLRTSQQLTLTPQLQQAIRLLQLSTLELSGEIGQMLQDNPFLELDDDEPAGAQAPDPAAIGAARNEGDDAEPEFAASSALPHDFEEGAVVDTDFAPDDREWDIAAPAGNARQPDDGLDPGVGEPAHESLSLHLQRQALGLRLAPEDAAILRLLIESLNDDGYLEDSIAQLAATLADDGDELDALDQLVHRFNFCLRLLQAMDPPGVGARSLGECLALQLQRRREQPGLGAAALGSIGHALTLLAQPDALGWLARRDLRRMAQATGLAEEQLQAAQALIARLEPKPGRAFVELDEGAIVPDVIVAVHGAGPRQRLNVQINPDALPRLRVHDLYARILSEAPGGERHAGLAQQLQEARWFVRNIQQRFDTILRVARAIAEHQRGFFTHGELAMRPLVQRELAEELDVHESTVSRATTAKYMATPRGTFELKYFFGSALATQAGGNASSTAVRELIRQLIAGEDPAQPISDGQVAELLKAQGIACARRTVAKYREALRIATATLRKAR